MLLRPWAFGARGLERQAQHDLEIRVTGGKAKGGRIGRDRGRTPDCHERPGARAGLFGHCDPDATLPQVDPDQPRHVELGAADAVGRALVEALGLAPAPDEDGAADGVPEAPAGAAVGCGSGTTDGLADGSGVMGSVGTSDTTFTSSRKS